MSGTSGPTTVMAIPSFSAKSLSSWKSVTGRFTHFSSLEVPPFPGAMNILPTLSDWASFLAIACSLAPSPIMSIFICSSISA
ncbi:hypothetical protein T472_0216835 [Youngiibacter fragilis 232.1]|uniref:Uncharacterized protein n=1 Tax=Youngiibacter fragilis 232.1 TaxID=994573 RepID=V7I2N1_9CLOT|nr:hypothetical protein T472_0216835 [Youngiibacter fragilis 232.1]